MLSDKRKILNWLYRQNYPTGTLEYDTLIIDAAEKGLRKSRIDAEAFAVSNSRRHWGYLLERIQIDAEKGLRPIFRVVSNKARRVVWSPSELIPTLSRSERQSLLRLQSRPSILRKIDELDDRQYEALGCVVSQFIGANKIHLTPKGNEGGVDFFASVFVHGRSHIFDGRHSPIRIVGQSKKYSSPVSVDKFKEFVTTLSDVRNHLTSVRPHIPSWFMRSRGPIVGWVIAHQGFQSGAENRSKNEGIILSDSIDLAEIASMSRTLPVTTPPHNRADELHERVRTVLTEFGTS